MKYSDYAQWTNRVTRWIEQHFATLRDKPVRAQTEIGAIAARLPAHPPEQAVDMETIMADFERIVPDGITHWQHPRFFAYFPSNAAPASMIAEQLTNAIASQCMLWQTSPAATEIEQVMIDWLRQAMDLPEGFKGVIQDSASSATLSAILTMRERATGFTGNDKGLSGQGRLRIYCSAQVHSSIDKACWVAGIGQDNLVKIPTNDAFEMDPTALQDAITADRAAGHIPAGLVLCTGGTSIGACDDLPPLIAIAKAEDLYTHLDAAWAGSAMICPEFRDVWRGAEDCDSIVFNPHKWLGANFDCSIQFLKDANIQRRTMGLRPSYLETPQAQEITNFNEWTVPLGRRFRALKLWFLIRAYGLEGLRSRIRNHVAWTKELESKLRARPDFTITTDSRLALFTFQYTPKGGDPNAASAELLQRINDDGRIYLTQTLHQGQYVIRFTAGQFDCTRDDVMTAYDVITELAA
ncbi:pyridoxal-dependent decarboxylase [Roseobacter sp. N2S]|uniref:pyridoxal phosphate-dependent decarboxylase family protein n=1 Tax=Roseobacter sp. N2S TaxID=2663844 RepID=UPI002862C290|nr:pyridoxal-dependent decarboxylase [Roseobacter sp. N2S]MDR6266206.1 aromatic-L-amino-acid decarboxylase [Roseobacter sp. N2S]